MGVDFYRLLSDPKTKKATLYILIPVLVLLAGLAIYGRHMNLWGAELNIPDPVIPKVIIDTPRLIAAPRNPTLPENPVLTVRHGDSLRLNFFVTNTEKDVISDMVDSLIIVNVADDSTFLFPPVVFPSAFNTKTLAIKGHTLGIFADVILKWNPHLSACYFCYRIHYSSSSGGRGLYEDIFKLKDKSLAIYNCKDKDYLAVSEFLQKTHYW